MGKRVRTSKFCLVPIRRWPWDTLCLQAFLGDRALTMLDSATCLTASEVEEMAR